MNAENGALNPYDAVLADLRAQRDKLDQAIALIESLRGGIGAGGGGAATSTATTPEAREQAAGDFLGMTIADAAIKLLGMRRRALGNAEMLQEFKRGGLVLTSADPMNVVNSVLTRRFNQVGDIVRVSRGSWGLQQWYPGRSFKKKPGEKVEKDAGGDATVNGDAPSEPVQPSKQKPDAAQE